MHRQHGDLQKSSFIESNGSGPLCRLAKTADPEKGPFSRLVSQLTCRSARTAGHNRGRGANCSFSTPLLVHQNQRLLIQARGFDHQQFFGRKPRVAMPMVFHPKATPNFKILFIASLSGFQWVNASICKSHLHAHAVGRAP